MKTQSFLAACGSLVMMVDTEGCSKHDVSGSTELKNPDKQTQARDLESCLAAGMLCPQMKVNWRSLIWSGLGPLLAIILAACGQASSAAIEVSSAEEDQSVMVVLPSPAASTATPVTTPTPSPMAAATPRTFTIIEPTATPTPVPGGQLLVLTADQKDSGWVVSEDKSIVTSYDPPNHFGDSFLYAGTLDGQDYHGAFQFDLSRIPRGTKIHGASLQMTGLRMDLLSEGQVVWRLQLLASEIDYNWRTHNYQQIHRAATWATFEPPLTQRDIGPGKVNHFEFNSAQLALLERRLLEGSGKVSFRIDGLTEGKDNLFAWDSGYGPSTQGAGPELFLSLGPPPLETPPPYYVVITSTPTPENIMTAAARSLQITAEAIEFGTVTPLPPNWVTPFVVTATPTPENEATAQVMSDMATAIALTTGEPANVITGTPTPTYVIITSTPTPNNIVTAAADAVRMTAEAAQVGSATPLPPNWVTPVVVTGTPTPVNQATAQYQQAEATAAVVVYGTSTPTPRNLFTATPTPVFVIITSVPTPESLEAAAAIALQLTSEAARIGTATPLPPNWVTPVVVTSTPTPANSATTEYWQALVLTTGTPTPTPANVQTATPTPVFVFVEAIVSPTPMATPSPTPQSVPAALLGKIVFLSDREGATAEERLRADRLKVTPQAIPQPYVFDPATGELGRLGDIWPHEVAAARNAWSADTIYETYTQALLWTGRKEVLAIHYYDYIYDVEQIVTNMGAGIVYDPVWSPVSEEIAFVATETGNDEIWKINRDGSGIRQLTRNTWEWDKHPTWSPDGQQIVFYSNRMGNQQLWIMNKDGTGQRLLMEPNPYNDWDPVWIKYLEPPPPLVRKPDWRLVKPADGN